MPEDDTKQPASMGREKALFGVWLAFLVAVIVLYAVVGARHG